MPRTARRRTSTVGERLKKLRIARGLTQTELGEKVGVSQRVVTYYEIEGVSPAPELLLKLAEALDVSTDEILGRAKPRRSAKAPESVHLWRRLKRIEALPLHDRKALLKMIDAVTERAEKRKAS